MYIIETKNLAKTYDTLTAVDSIVLRVREGEIFGLLGPNGAGKTSTLLMLATLLRPSGGTALVNGYDIVRQPHQVRKSIGIVFQDPSSDDLLTGYENLRLHALMYGVEKSIRRERIDEVLDLVDLTARRDDPVRTYSGGMRRRLEIARGLLHRPKVLFLDEPTLGLDPSARELAWEYIEKLVTRERITVILTTHYMDEADALCDRIAIIDLGKVVALDTPGNLKRKMGGDIIRIRAASPRVDALRRLKFVKRVDSADGVLTITIAHAGEHLQEVLNAAGRVESVEVRSPTLNDVFLHFAGREFREEEAEGGWGQRMMAYRSKK